MARVAKHSAEVIIRNTMGFHVRPVQRFAELAQAFKADVEVELGSRKVPGKSVINLVSLGGRCGDKITIAARGEDARQCVGVLAFLASERFFVEDDVDVAGRPDRHIERLATIASCFESQIKVVLDGNAVDAKEVDSIAALGLSPLDMPAFEIEGSDARQARAVLENLVNSCFYIEDKMGQPRGKAS
jgi:phosphotransferase system HPr (HPr) family protein